MVQVTPWSTKRRCFSLCFFSLCNVFFFTVRLYCTYTHKNVFLLKEGDGEMDVTSLSGAWASGRPVDLLLC